VPFILWIDDEPIRASLIKDINATVIFAHGYDQIKYYLEVSNIKAEWDLIILDHDMPLLNGLDVIKDFYHILGNSPIILCSANAEARLRQQLVLSEYDIENVIDCSVCAENFAETVEEFLF